MDFWDFLTYAAWGISALLLLYIVVDAFMVSTKYSEDFLLSSREGEDKLLDSEARSSTGE